VNAQTTTLDEIQAKGQTDL